MTMIDDVALAAIDRRIAHFRSAASGIFGWSVTQAKLNLLTDLRREITEELRSTEKKAFR